MWRYVVAVLVIWLGWNWLQSQSQQTTPGTSGGVQALLVPSRLPVVHPQLQPASGMYDTGNIYLPRV